MKSMLLMLTVSICILGWKSEEILHVLGMAKATPPAQTTSIAMIPKTQHQGMSLEEYAALSKTDPHAYQKLIQSNTVHSAGQEERSEVDKLMNFFTRLKYE